VTNSIGDFQFGLLSGELDGEAVKSGNLERFEFTWEGQDENDLVFGSSWLKLSGKDKIRGRIKFHLGDSSGFLTVRVKDYEHSEI